MTVELSPAQQTAYGFLERALYIGSLVTLANSGGRGTSTVLCRLASDIGATYLGAKDLLNVLENRNPGAIEETLHHVVMHALQQNDIVVLDDFSAVVECLTGCHFYPRSNFIEAALTGIAAYVQASEKRLVVGCESPGEVIGSRHYATRIPEFGIEDYRFFCRQFLSTTVAEGLDYAKLFRFAPK